MKGNNEKEDGNAGGEGKGGGTGNECRDRKGKERVGREGGRERRK